MARKRPPAKTVAIRIPEDLHRSLGRLIEGTGFASVADFAIYVLRDVVAGGKLKDQPAGLSELDVEAVHKRLQALGYIE